MAICVFDSHDQLSLDDKNYWGERYDETSNMSYEQIRLQMDWLSAISVL